MTVGPGKYDAEVTLVREATHAQGVLLLVFRGDRGTGFSAQLPFDMTIAMPALLRDMAQQIEADMKEGIL